MIKDINDVYCVLRDRIKKDDEIRSILTMTRIAVAVPLLLISIAVRASFAFHCLNTVTKRHGFNTKLKKSSDHYEKEPQTSTPQSPSILQTLDLPTPSLSSKESSLSSTVITRRDALLAASGVALSSLLLLGMDSAFALEPSAAISPPKTILLTGANSGIGLEAAKRLAAQGANLILPCRTHAKSVATIESLVKDFGFAKEQFVPAECDLTSLTSIHSFVSNSLQTTHGISSLDVVCLNAGVARNTDATDVARTQDGFELTVGTNHLGHFYLQHLLLPLLSRSKIGGRLVITASGIHDPESPGGAQGVPATLGNLLGLERDGKRFEMVDGGAFNADKAYKDSKVHTDYTLLLLQRDSCC
jgi:protochlorophyllide reductase